MEEDTSWDSGASFDFRSTEGLQSQTAIQESPKLCSVLPSCVDFVDYSRVRVNYLC